MKNQLITNHVQKKQIQRNVEKEEEKQEEKLNKKQNKKQEDLKDFIFITLTDVIIMGIGDIVLIDNLILTILFKKIILL